MGNQISASITKLSQMDPLAMETLTKGFGEWKATHGKNFIILKGVSGITSSISSSALIWMIVRSQKGLSTTQNRLLVGLCVFDLMSSLSVSLFNIMAPSDDNYFAWNARGNQTSCDVQGFIQLLGIYGGLFYNVALNIFFVAVVKYNKRPDYIRKIEPFLHGVPIAGATVIAITRLLKNHFNDDGYGACVKPVHYPRHCYGYEVGEVRDGFEIPCGRGYDGAWTVTISLFVLLFLPVVIIIGSLGLIYARVKKAESIGSQYGRASLRFGLNRQQQPPEIVTPTQQEQQGSERRLSSWRLSIRNSLRLEQVPTSTLQEQGSQQQTRRLSSLTWNRQSSSMPTSNDTSKSRAVMHKALGYSFAWILSYGTYMIVRIILLIPAEVPLPLAYITTIFLPLQGFFNLVIYMYPKVVKNKQRENMSLCKAIYESFLSKGDEKMMRLQRRMSNLNSGHTTRMSNLNSGHTTRQLTNSHQTGTS